LRLHRSGRGVTQLRERRTEGAGEPEGGERHVLNILRVAPARRCRAGEGQPGCRERTLTVYPKGVTSPRKRLSGRAFGALVGPRAPLRGVRARVPRRRAASCPSHRATARPIRPSAQRGLSCYRAKRGLSVL
jgi:hypothetical protein